MQALRKSGQPVTGTRGNVELRLDGNFADLEFGDQASLNTTSATDLQWYVHDLWSGLKFGCERSSKTYQTSRI